MASAGVDFAIIVALCIGLFILLCLMFKLANEFDERIRDQLDEVKKKRALAADDFEEKNKYSWDYVYVFKVRREEESVSDYQRNYSIKYIVNRLAAGGFETRMFYSVQYDEIYCKMRCPLDRLLVEADRENYLLPLDETTLRLACENGRPGIWAPLDIRDEYQQSTLEPYAHIFAKYEYARDEVANLYKKQKNGTVLRGVDRLKLIENIMRARAHEGGCQLDVSKLIKEGALLGAFPLHDRMELLQLERKWLKYWDFPWNQPVDDVKDYFGEKIGLYFLWLGHYTTWLCAPAFVGLLCWINVAVAGNNPDVPAIPVFSVFMALWATFFLESWKRKESRYAMLWGMKGFEQEEQDRPQFEGVESVSPIDGTKERYFPRSEFMRRVGISAITIAGLILVVIGVVACIFILKIYLTFENPVYVSGTNIGPIIASIANAVQIQVMSYIYFGMALKMTIRENHRTDTEFEDSLIAKTFLFQFVNSYASLFYISFVKEFVEEYGCTGTSCMAELQVTMSTIFLSRLAIGNTLEVGVPYMKRMLAKRNEKDNVKDPDRVMSVIEEEFLADEYDVMLGTFADYSEMIIQYGYATLFVSAFPLALLMSLVNNYIEIRVDGWKLCQNVRRPQPRGAEDIGTWYTILEIMSVAAVMVNSALICFSGKIFLHATWIMRIWYFVIFEHGLLLLKFTLAALVPDEAREVQIQVARGEFIAGKVIDNVIDEDDDDMVVAGGEMGNLEVHSDDES